MKNYIKYIVGLVVMLSLPTMIVAQDELDCDPLANLPVTQGDVIINYGSATNAFSFQNKSSFTVAQPLIGTLVAQDEIMQFGFWSGFLIPPYPPQVTVSKGDFPDRITISWELDPLSPTSIGGYSITRDGAYLGAVDNTTTQFIDFNVQAGETYEYGVYGKNQYGSGSPGVDLGFVNPNGSVTGVVNTFSGNPVAGSIVRLTPTEGNSLLFDGVDDNVCVTYDEMIPTEMFTVSAWVKIGDTYTNDGIIDLGSDNNENYWIKTTDAGSSAKGVVIGVGDGTQAYEIEHEFAEDADGWHQVTMVYSAGSLLLYIDGNFTSARPANIVSVPARVTLGSTYDNDNYYDGYLDDVRIYDRPLTGSEILLTKDITVGKSTDGLVVYYKFDEGIGEKVFDLTDNNIDGFLHGVTFSDESADITNAGVTDDTGFYSIQGINYSKDESFKATPSKIFYSNYALEFNSAYEAYAELAPLDLPDSATIEIVIHPFDIDNYQPIMVNGDDNLELFIEDGNFKLAFSGDEQILGPATKEYQHLALVMDGDSDAVNYYNDGTLITSVSFGSITGDWSGDTWKLATDGESTPTYYNGLIDEVSFYKGLNTLADIQLHASTGSGGGTDIGNGNIISYYDLNEGVDTRLYDSGPNFESEGTVYNATFSIITRTQEEFPHVFTPGSRVVTINTSNTAASGVDFTDESTVPVSGVVRFEGTFCYQDSVELLVNGLSHSPPVFTDSVGRFTIDLEPGTTANLTPTFGTGNEEHAFAPAFHKVIKLNRPVSNILFSNLTKRTIIGQLSGGDSRLPVSNESDVVRMKVASAGSQCIEEEIALDNVAGNFEFKDLPAIVMTTALVYHDNNIIYEKMQEEGAKTSDMRLKERDTLDFRYYSQPEVYLEPFPEGLCPDGNSLPFPYLYESGPDNGFRVYDKTVRMFEEYAGGTHYLENFDLIITNNLNDEQPDTISVRDTSAYLYEFVAGQANIGGDFTKFLQVKGISPRNEDDVVVQRAIVLGEREREASFATTAPTMPLLILRDPPGDGSSATWEKGATYCNTWSDMRAFKEGGEISESLKLGGDIEFSTGVGVSKTTKIELENTTTIEATFETSETTTREANFCMTATQTITTSDSDDVPTEDGDVYYGAAINMKFSGNDVLYLDIDACEVKNDSVTISIAPEGFETEYIYSGWQLKGTVIPNLELIGDTVSANAWRSILEYNESLKNDGNLTKNISFDGLTTYSESKEVEQSKSRSFEFSVEDNGSIAGEFGLEVDGIGYGLNLKASFGSSRSNTTESSNSETSTISYTLADDDPNDSYSVDIMEDPVMGTPYYQLVAGESMCPWIPGTLNREEIGFQIDRVTAVNIPENEAAIFKVTMTNLGQTARDPLVYMIGLKQGSNIDGALVTMEGESLINPLFVQLQPEESKEFLVSVEKGPDVNVFNYDDIGLFAASQCQFEHSLGLGYNLAAYADWHVNHPGEPLPIESDEIYEGIYNVVDLQKFYKQFSLSVEFIEPCSRVNIGFPMQDWVQTPEMGDNLTINLNDFNSSDPDLELFRLQYRRTGGDGAWINITEVPKDSIDNSIFHNVVWDMSLLSDGPYEIRALAICYSGLDSGISKVIQGRKETQPPKVFGTPQPADGILSPGDEISIEFTKRINCSNIFQADGNGTNINLNNIALQDMTMGGILIDAVITCKEDKIFIVPNVPNQFIENHTLRVTATDIEDVYGNPAEQEVWEFFVNRSNLYWVGGDVDEVVVEGSTLSIEREIRNQSGDVTNFELYDIPQWVDVFPATGTLAPGASIPVTFQFPDNLIAKAYDQIINLSEVVGSSTTPQIGNEPLKVDLRVACPRPQWEIDASLYSFSMNMVVQLDIEGVMSDDKLDEIGAFVDGQLRGLASIEYNAEIDKHLAFLTIYSNQGSGETVDFRIWDASECQLFANVLESFPYAADGLIGTPNDTQVIHTDGQVLRKIDIHTGWNWLSFNIEFPDPQVNTALSSLSNPSNALIKDQVDFSSYSDGAESWFGTLDELGFKSLYQYNSEASDSMFLVGYPVDQTTPIPLVAGWNWISYLPQIGAPLNTALASLEPLNGDVIKSQLQFAVYVAGTGWVGNLDYMSAPNGYLINLANADTIVYPVISELSATLDEEFKYVNTDKSTELTSIDKLSPSELPFSHWSIDPTKYEHSMNLIGIVHGEDNSPILADGDEVAVFAGEEIRGSGKVTYIEDLDVNLIFMTIYANVEGESLTYRYYDSSINEEFDLRESNEFNINKIIGSVDQPFIFNLHAPTNTDDLDASSEEYQLSPNPFSDKLNIDFVSNTGKHVEVIVTDVLGSVVHTFTHATTFGANHITWKPDANLIGGTYFISLNDGESSVTQKILFIR